MLSLLSLNAIIHSRLQQKKSDDLRDLYEFLEYRELLRHVPTWWLSLMPAIDRWLLCWLAQKSYFASQGEDDMADLT